MANLTDLPPRLRPILEESIDAMAAIMKALENGTITADEWYELMKVLLARYHTAGMMAGAATTELPSAALPLLQATLDEGQYPYLKNFLTVIKAAPEFNQAWYARATLYALSPKTSWWEGDVYRQVGRFLPLPAMPAQGTICHTNCLCAWRIETIDEEAGDYDAYWERHAKDSCQTCIQREADWYPVRIRGGQLIL